MQIGNARGEQDRYHGVLGRGFGVEDIEKPEVRELFFSRAKFISTRFCDTRKRCAI